MITHLKIRNFKALQDADVPLRSLSLFTGLNGMGKSTLMQVILLLRQSYQQEAIYSRGLLLNGTLVQIGTARDALSVAAPNDTIVFELQTDESMTDRLYRWEFNCKSSGESEPTDVLPVLNFENGPPPSGYYESEAEKIKFALYSGTAWLPFRGDNFQYLCAERLSPQTAYSTSTFDVQQRRQLGKHGENTAHFLSSFGEEKIAFSNLLYPNDTTPNTLLQQVGAWLNEISPGLRLKTTENSDLGLVQLGYEFQTTVGVTRAFRPTNVGFGLSYILPVLTAILSAKPGALLLIENPESHIHPRGQSRLGELLALAAQNNVQLLVETHSDHVLNGIRVAVKKHKLDPTSVGLYFFERAPLAQGGHHSIIRQPQIDQDGRIDDWPEGFFDEWDKNLIDLL